MRLIAPFIHWYSPSTGAVHGSTNDIPISRQCQFKVESWGNKLSHFTPSILERLKPKAPPPPPVSAPTPAPDISDKILSIDGQLTQRGPREGYNPNQYYIHGQTTIRYNGKGPIQSDQFERSFYF